MRIKIIDQHIYSSPSHHTQWSPLYSQLYFSTPFFDCISQLYFSADNYGQSTHCLPIIAPNFHPQILEPEFWVRNRLLAADQWGHEGSRGVKSQSDQNSKEAVLRIWHEQRWQG